MRDFYYRTYSKVALLPYIGGTIIHVVRLLRGDAVVQISYEVDYVVVLLGGYAGFGFVLFFKRNPFKSLIARILHALVAFHLLGSAVLHAHAILTGRHDLFAVFSYRYSYFAVAYFVVLGTYCFLLQRRIGMTQSLEL